MIGFISFCNPHDYFRMFYFLTMTYVLLVCASVSCVPLQSSGSNTEHEDANQHVHVAAGDLDALLNIIKPTPKHPKDISISVEVSTFFLYHLTF